MSKYVYMSENNFSKVDISIFSKQLAECEYKNDSIKPNLNKFL